MIRSALRRVPPLHRVARTIRRALEPTVERRIARALRHHRHVFFIQIGSCDGQSGDPLHDLILANPGWSGILVEPMTHLFGRLRETYANRPGLMFENVAIAPPGVSHRPFFHLADEAADALMLPPYFDQLGSFDRQHLFRVLRNAASEAELQPFVRQTAVRCVGFDELCRLRGVERLDLLHIDAEGADMQILSQVDLRKYRPAVVLFEQIHLNDEEKHQSRELLVSAGYRVRNLGMDAIATPA